MARRYDWGNVSVSGIDNYAEGYIGQVTFPGLSYVTTPKLYCIWEDVVLEGTYSGLPHEFDLERQIRGYRSLSDLSNDVDRVFTLLWDSRASTPPYEATVVDQNSPYVLGKMQLLNAVPRNFTFTLEPKAIPVGLEDVISYIERKVASNVLLSGNVQVVRPAEPLPNFENYGVVIKLDGADWLETRREKIGNILTDHYRINVDFVFNRSMKTTRDAISTDLGLSHWESTVKFLLANSTNDGLFRDSYWTASGPMEQNSESYIIRGILNVVVDNPILQT